MKDPLQTISKLKSTTDTEQVGLKKSVHKNFQTGLEPNTSS